MKRILAILMAIVLLLGLAAAALAEGEAPVFSTMAEAMDEDVNTGMWSWGTDCFVTVAQYEGRYIRAVAMLDDATAQKVDEIYQLEDYEEMDRQIIELAKSLAVTYTEDLSPAMLSQDEVDALAGRTVGELLDAGWQMTSYGYGNEVEFTMSNGLFDYNLVMNESIETYEERSETEDFGDFTVKSASFCGISGFAVDLSYRADGSYEPMDDGVDLSGGDIDLLSTLIQGL